MADAYAQHPDAVLDYPFDWSPWLGDDTLATSTFEAGAGLAIANPSFTNTGSLIWVSCVETSGEYEVTNHITTADGRVEHQTITIIIRESGARR